MNLKDGAVMKMWKDKTWQNVATGTDGNAMLFGVNIFDYSWTDTKKTAVINDRVVSIFSVFIRNCLDGRGNPSPTDLLNLKFY